MPDADPHRDHRADAAEGGEEHGQGRLGRLRKRHLTPEERLAALIDEHRRELEEQSQRFEETLADLERRERLLSDSRASIERLLRLGTKNLDARESGIAELLQELEEREERLRREEESLAQRRSEVGAVELKRLALEQRERALEAREQQLSEADGKSAAEEQASGARVDQPPELAFVHGARYGLVEIDPQPLAPGDSLEIDGVEHVVARIGPSPLPGDDRRCAFLL